MASATFQDYNQNTPITSAWLNDVNQVAYAPSGQTKTAVQMAAAWVRFSVNAGVVTIQQSNNITSVVRTAPGVYVITYAVAMAGAMNSYGMSMGIAGFLLPSAETATTVTVSAFSTAQVATDPGSVSVQIFGAN